MQGDVTGIYDSSGNIKAEYIYDAWGNCTVVIDSDGIGTLNPIRYRGYYYDSEIGLYYLQSRYYDPTVGRFINADVLIAAGQGILGHIMHMMQWRLAYLWAVLYTSQTFEPGVTLIITWRIITIMDIHIFIYGMER